VSGCVECGGAVGGWGSGEHGLVVSGVGW